MNSDEQYFLIDLLIGTSMSIETETLMYLCGFPAATITDETFRYVRYACLSYDLRVIILNGFPGERIGFS
jgi:hypothetical protein